MATIIPFPRNKQEAEPREFHVRFIQVSSTQCGFEVDGIDTNDPAGLRNAAKFLRDLALIFEADAEAIDTSPPEGTE